MTLTEIAAVAFIVGALVGGGVSKVVFSPSRSNVDLLIHSSVRMGWVCHDKGVSYDECLVMLRDGADAR